MMIGGGGQWRDDRRGRVVGMIGGGGQWGGGGGDRRGRGVGG